jgi:hypothetical protein
MTAITSESPLQHRALSGRIEARLRDLELQSQMRDVEALSGVSLCSNDYLGLSRDVRLKQALLEGIEISGRLAATGSRLLSGHHPIWDEVEDEFTGFAGTESALYFNSGFAANTGLLGARPRQDDVVFSDALNHASIVDGIRLGRARKIIYPHCDLNWLKNEMRRRTNVAGAKIIVTESIFSMDGDCAPLRELFALGDKYGAEVIVDEAHAHREVRAQRPWPGRRVGIGETSAGDRAYLRQGTGQHGRFCVRERSPEAVSYQPCAELYFQHRPSTLSRLSGAGRVKTRNGDGSGARALGVAFGHAAGKAALPGISPCNEPVAHCSFDRRKQ